MDPKVARKGLPWKIKQHCVCIVNTYWAMYWHIPQKQRNLTKNINNRFCILCLPVDFAWNGGIVKKKCDGGRERQTA